MNDRSFQNWKTTLIHSDLRSANNSVFRLTFTHPSQNYYSCPFSPVWASAFPWNSVAQEWSPDFPKLIRGPEHLATTTRLPARADTKPPKSGTMVARIRTHGVLSTGTFSLPPGLAQNKIQLSHPGWKVPDKAVGPRHPTQGHPVGGLFPGAGVVHQRNRVRFVVPLKGRGPGKP